MLRVLLFVAVVFLLGLGFALACEDGATLQKGRGQLNVEPASVDFGKVTQGQSAMRNIVVTNHGAVAVDARVILEEAES